MIVFCQLKENGGYSTRLFIDSLLIISNEKIKNSTSFQILQFGDLSSKGFKIISLDSS
jgi:hypothetical protein